MIKYIAYCRKSTDEKDKQVLSIEQQLAELKEFAKKENLNVIAYLTEAKTAKKPGRPVFNKLLQKIEVGEANGILAWHPDRLARNTIDGGKIIYLLDLGCLKSLRFPNFWFENTPQGRFMINIAFSQARYYVDNLAENVKRGQRHKIKQGIWCLHAPMGYKNDKNAKTVVIDPEKAKVIRRAFELYATGEYSLHDIGKFFYEHGIKNKVSGGYPNESNLRRMLMRPFYYGMMVYKGELYEGKHQPIISKSLFDKVQKVIKKRGKHCQKRSPRYNFAFTGFIKCSRCGYSITAEQRNFYFPRTNNRVSYIYYHCTKWNRRSPCRRKKYIREEVLAKQFREIIASVSISEKWANKMFELLEKDKIQEKQQAQQELQRLTSELVEIERKLDRLLEAYLDEIIDTEDYQRKKNQLMETKAILKSKIKKIKTKGSTWIEAMENFIKLALRARKIACEKNNRHDLAFMAKKVGSKYFLKDHQLEFSLNFPFRALAAGVGAASAPSKSDQIIAFGQAKYFVDNLSENVKRGIREKLRRGVYPNKAPLGYSNEPRKRTIEIDPKTAKLVRKAFKLFSTGTYSYVDIQNFLFRKGLKGKTGKPFHIDKIRNMLKNSFYYGIIKFTGEIYQGSHKPLISKLLFDKCQEIISKRAKPQGSYKHDFPFLGLAKCAECGSAITGDRHFKFYPRTRGKVEYNLLPLWKKERPLFSKICPGRGF